MSALALVLLLATPPDTLVVGNLADPVSLEPYRATDLVSAAVVSSVCETLVRWKSDGSRPEAALATTWATLDNRSWTFTLREGVRFHDGAPLDADAVVDNFEHLRRHGLFHGVAERVGPRIVAFTLERPSAALLATLSQPSFSLQSPAALRRAAGPAVPVGTGPFRFAAAQPGSIELVANADYWGGRPRLQRIVFRRLPSEDALTAALVAGDVDVTSAVSQDRVEALRRVPGLSLDSSTGLDIAFLSVNNERRPLDDVRVRQALARAIDRAALVEEVLGGHGVPARNPLPPLLWGYDARSRDLTLDRAAARRLLAQAGLPDGFETTLMATASPRPYLPKPLRVAARLRDDLARVGIRARIQEVPSWAEYVGRGSRGDYDLAVLGWQADTVDPNDFLSALLASESIGTTNRSRYRSPAMDSLLKRGRMSTHPGERLKIYHEAQAQFREDMPWVPLYHVSVFTAYRRTVRGLVTGTTGMPRYDRAWKAERESGSFRRPRQFPSE